MAYIGYEDIPARTINYRIVPALRKYYRADGTFDLFDLKKYQANCIHYLANLGEAGINVDNSESISMGDYNLNDSETNPSFRSSFTMLNLYKTGNISTPNYGWSISFILDLNNSAGLYPYYLIYENKVPGGNNNYSYGSISLRIRDTEEDEVLVQKRGYNLGSISWSLDYGKPSKVMDYKDYEYIRSSWQNGSATGAAFDINFRAYFIHRFSEEHPLYRYYR